MGHLTSASNQLESPDSSSPIVTRAVAAGLRDEFFETYPFPAWQKIVLQILGRFPQSFTRFVVSHFEVVSGLDPAKLTNLSIRMLATERLADYQDIDGPFDTITIGAALGGASAHLALALGGPFLPVAFVTTLRGGSIDGDVNTYFNRSKDLALQLAERNPEIITIQHYDPIHDEWMTRRVNHLRVKLLQLPEVYQQYIHRRLAPGGTLCYLDCQAKWLHYRVGERSVVQVGGWGDISPQEFLNGSPRISTYCERIGLQYSNWQLSQYPLETGPESEWGCEPAFARSLENFCQQNGYHFCHIALPEPHDFSRLAYQAISLLLTHENRQPAGVLVEMFSQFDSSAVRLGGLLPVWLVFNTRDSLAFLRQMRSHFPASKPVFFSPLSTFTNTPDLVPWHQWEQVLSGLSWQNIGARPSHYPSDALALASWSGALHNWVRAHYHPLRTTLTPEELSALVDN